MLRKKNPLKIILIIFSVWRIVLLIPLYLGHVFLPYRPHQEYTNLWFYIKPYFPVEHFLLYPWANFDGVHYLSIAGLGYTNDARFLPLFPLLIRFVTKLIGGGVTYGATQFFIALFSSNVFFILSLLVFYKLIRFDYPKNIAIWTIIFLLIFPTSFFFASIYTESLFLLLSLLAFYYVRRKNWLLASFFGLLLTITRLPGICIFPILLYEFFYQEEKISSKIIPIFLVPIGIIALAFFNLKKWGNIFYFIQAHAQLGNSRSTSSIVLFPQTIFRYLKLLISITTAQFEWWIALLELTTFIFVSILLFIAWKKKIRSSYLLFSLLCFLLPTSSGTFTAIPRYILILFPIFIAIALIKNKVVKIIYSVISIILLFILLMFFSRGYFIA